MSLLSTGTSIKGSEGTGIASYKTQLKQPTSPEQPAYPTLIIWRHAISDKPNALNTLKPNNNFYNFYKNENIDTKEWAMGRREETRG